MPPCAQPQAELGQPEAREPVGSTKRIPIVGGGRPGPADSQRQQPGPAVTRLALVGLAPHKPGLAAAGHQTRALRRRLGAGTC
jgi:hypothetical protein